MTTALVAKVKGGPVTTGGKAVARLNGVVHGLRALLPVIATERQAEWEQYHAGIVDALAPVGAVEMEFAERVAVLLWRLRRVARYETDTISAAQADAEEDYVNTERLFGRAEGYTSIWPEDLRWEAREMPARARMLRKLATLPDDARIRGNDVRGILSSCDRAATKHDPAFSYEAFSLPGIPDDLTLDDAPDLTAGQMRVCLAVIAEAVGVASDTLTTEMIDELEYDGRKAKWRLEKTEKQVGRMREARMLPGADTLDKIQRYEAHLNRQLLHTLHELEAMQERRMGRAAPLARLDVSGVER